ncbi:AI-2E family transporter [Ulvibacter litoralis]|uniref:Predicted PurR-regulated permease PerM n=1 Tax=Ulvibacter litoralis TaxID=227084 RepID=A0A1G7FR73_9FLAO|nr:AI-2E family transporter [Ulvibacter litoralis]GHC50068.1 AI-2E family transporter [Ulvibacter litoralis]SDE78416.1 Predicted PurR-regulated permease PerM [Ulvibacter litoralis]
MKAKVLSFAILRTIGVLAGVILLIWFLFKIQPLILYIGIAAVISLVGRPVVNFLNKRLKFSHTIAAMVALILVIVSVSVLLKIFVPIVVEQSKNISNIDFDLVKKDLNELSMQASDYLGLEQIDLIETIKQTEFVQNFSLELIPSFVDIFFNKLGPFVIGLFATLFISFFLLKDEDLFAKTVVVFAHPGREERFVRTLNKIKELLSRYFLGLLFQILILTLFYSVLLLFLDVKNAVAIALICAFLNLVPYLGPIIGGAVMMLVVVSNNLGADFSSELLPLLFYVFIGYCIAQLFDNLISQPVIFGKSVRSHPLEIFIVILISGYVFGISGMILAVPTYTALKVIAKEFLSEYKIVKRLTKNL